MTSYIELWRNNSDETREKKRPSWGKNNSKQRNRSARSKGQKKKQNEKREKQRNWPRRSRDKKPWLSKKQRFVLRFRINKKIFLWKFIKIHFQRDEEKRQQAEEKAKRLQEKEEIKRKKEEEKLREEKLKEEARLAEEAKKKEAENKFKSFFSGKKRIITTTKVDGVIFVILGLVAGLAEFLGFELKTLQSYIFPRNR